IDEAAHHMRDGVDLTDVGEKLVAETFALGGAAHEARDIDEGESRRLDPRRLREFRQHVEARIGHHHLAHVRLDGAEGIVRRLRRRGCRQRVEERRLADVGEAEGAAFEAHDVALIDLRRACHRPIYVVPAKAGTHNHSLWNMGPRFRGDDGGSGSHFTRQVLPTAWVPEIPWPAWRGAPCSENSRPGLSPAARRCPRCWRTALPPTAARPWRSH